MKEYSVYIQDVFYKNMSGEYTSDILRQINLDIEQGLVPNYDNTKPANIKILPPS